MGFASGFQVGASAVERGLKMREEQALKEQLAQAYAKPESFVDYTPEQQRQIQGLQAAGGYDVQAIPGAEGQVPTLRYSAQPNARYYDDMGQPEAPIEFAPQQVQRYGGQTVAGQFDPTQLRGLQAREAARVVGASGDYRGAAALEAQAAEQEFQAKYRPLQLEGLERRQRLEEFQLTDAERKQRQTQTFDTGLEEVNRTTYEKPEQRTAAILSLVEKTQGPEAAQRLRTSYGTEELNQITLQAKKFDEGFRQSRAKGVFAAMDWFDEQNTTFKLERDPKNPYRVIQVNEDGTRALFADAKNERELGMIVDAKAKPGGFLELAKFDLDKQKAEAAIRASNAQARDAGKSAIEKNLKTLQDLGIKVSPEDVRAMAGIKQEKLSPEASARLELITASVKGNESPRALEAAQTAITDLFKGEALNKRNATIVSGLRTANEKNDLPTALDQLTKAGVGRETIVGLARQAGVELPANFAPAAAAAPAAAVSPRTGLSTGSRQQQYGPLTPRATIEADARAGVPAAVAYLKYMADLERARTENAMRAAEGM